MKRLLMMALVLLAACSDAPLSPDAQLARSPKECVPGSAGKRACPTPPDTTVTPPDTVPPDTVAPSRRDSVIAFIVGPQLALGASEWTAYDEMLAANAARHYQHFMLNGKQETYYYDLGLVLYVLYAKSGDPEHLRMAQEVTDKWFEFLQAAAPTGSIAPRSVALGSVLVRAVETGDSAKMAYAEMWVRRQYQSWLGARLGNATLHYGLRDGGYALQYTAYAAYAHPDPAVRAEFEGKALAAARDYYARLQYADGGWYWGDSGASVRIQKPDGSYWRHSQPFMVGLMLDGMVAVHRLTGDATVAASILRAAEWLHSVQRVDSVLVNGVPVGWRGNWYFVFEPGTPLPADDPALSECSEPIVDRGRVVQGKRCLGGNDGTLGTGTDTNAIRDVRQMVPEVLHVYGYAFELTGDPMYREWGDDAFAASFGKGAGPGADAYYCLADYIAKSYNQSYRSSGTYLVRRLGR